MPAPSEKVYPLIEQLVLRQLAKSESEYPTKDRGDELPKVRERSQVPLT